MPYLNELEYQGSQSGKPKKKCVIADCGEITEPVK